MLTADTLDHPVAAFFSFFSSLEYSAGWCMERILQQFNIWDYSDTRFHLTGESSLTFSLIWALLGVGSSCPEFHPVSWRSRIHAVVACSPLRPWRSCFLFTFDRFFPPAKWKRLGFAFALQAGFPSMRKLDLDFAMSRFSRLRLAFPYLNLQLQQALQRSVPEGWLAQWRSSYRRIRENIESRRPLEEEFNAIVEDILKHPEFLRLKEIRQNPPTTTRSGISFLSYRISKQHGSKYLSCRARRPAARFFLYDWLNHDVPQLAPRKIPRDWSIRKSH